ncbi:decarboxylase [Streptomyces hygroscopicus]|uniref:maleate cis-trans isomerase family protein n=1 Tax=Streptomyces hygroscopicus TaxID=1912 RepID=UPI00223F287C|nr:decarboxylase [Streptomyces hygroscopicus]MCW7945993.1 decarboxylase [Streptomyces hygroscopicus]
MTALGFLYPGHFAEDDYPRIEQLLASDIRVDLVHTAGGEDTHRVDALRETGSPRRLAAGVEELRLAGVEAIVWASTSGSFVHGWEGAHEQVRALARTAGMPASSTSFAFVHAAREIGARRVAVAATYPDDITELFAGFLREADTKVMSVHSAGIVTAAEVAGWGVKEVLELARQADHAEADAILLPDAALHTVAHLPALEQELAKPVLTANQVTVWEALRLVDRRVNAPELGTLFTKEPIVQV